MTTVRRILRSLAADPRVRAAALALLSALAAWALTGLTGAPTP